MRADDSAQQTPSAGTAAHNRVVRGANALDRYSLALQLVQVYPIVLGGVALVVPIRWLRILAAVLALLISAAWAVLRERAAEFLASHTRADAAPLPVPTGEKVSAAEALEVRGIHVDIWLHPGEAFLYERGNHRTHHHPNLPRVHRTSSMPTPRTHSRPADDPKPGP